MGNWLICQARSPRARRKIPSEKAASQRSRCRRRPATAAPDESARSPSIAPAGRARLRLPATAKPIPTSQATIATVALRASRSLPAACRVSQAKGRASSSSTAPTGDTRNPAASRANGRPNQPARPPRMNVCTPSSSATPPMTNNTNVGKRVPGGIRRPTHWLSASSSPPPPTSVQATRRSSPGERTPSPLGRGLGRGPPLTPSPPGRGLGRGPLTPSPSGRGLGRGPPLTPSPFGRGLGRGPLTPSPLGRGLGRGPLTPSPFGRGLGRGLADSAVARANSLSGRGPRTPSPPARGLGRGPPPTPSPPARGLGRG